MKSISERTGESIVPHGAVAANALGLSTQIPMREMYLTSGPSRSITLGRRKIELQHPPQWQLREGIAGTAVRALLSLGESVSEETMSELWGRLNHAEQKKLMASVGSAPAWLATNVARYARMSEGLSVA